MNFDKIYDLMCEKFKIKNDKNFDKNLMKSKAKVIKEVLKACDSNEVDRKKIVKALETVNKGLGKNSKNITLSKEFSKDEVKSRKAIHDKAKVFFANYVANKYESFYQSKQVNVDEDRHVLAFIQLMSKDKSEMNDISNTVNIYNNPASENEKVAARAKLKEYFTRGFKKMMNTLDNFKGMKSDEDLLNYYEKYGPILDCCSEFEVTKQGSNMKKIADAFGFTFDNNLNETWDKGYSKLAVTSTLSRSRLFALANPLYPTIDIAEGGIAQDYIIMNDSDAKKSNSVSLSEADNIDKVTKSNNADGSYTINAFNGYKTQAGNMNPIKYSQYKMGKFAQESDLYSFHITTLEDQLNFIRYKNGVDKSLEELTYQDNDGNKFNKDEALIKMLKGESILIRDGNKFIYKGKCDPDRSSGFLDCSNNTNIPYKQDKLDKLFNDANETLKEIDKLKTKKEKAWFNFTRKKYEKQINEKKTALNTFKIQYNAIRNEYFAKGATSLATKAERLSVEGVNPFHDNVYDIKTSLYQLASVDASNTKVFNEKIKNVQDKCKIYMENKLKNNYNASNYQKQDDMVAAILESVDNFKNSNIEMETALNEKFEFINEKINPVVKEVNNVASERTLIEVNEAAEKEVAPSNKEKEADNGLLFDNKKQVEIETDELEKQ